MLTDKQSSVEWVSRLERGLAIMHDATWPQRLTKGWVDDLCHWAEIDALKKSQAPKYPKWGWTHDLSRS